MRTLSKLLLCILGIPAIIAASGAAWLYFDQSGLPDVRFMRGLVAPAEVPVDLECLNGHPVVISYASLGANARNALSAADAPEDSPSVVTNMLARRLFCRKEKHLHRNVDEIRMAIQLKRRYSKQDLFTMLANSAYFGDGIVGIEAASVHYFRKHSNELRIEEAAVLAALISRPNFYSPALHPDRVVNRRNEVIDTMVRNGAISQEDALVAEAAPVLVAGSSTR